MRVTENLGIFEFLYEKGFGGFVCSEGLGSSLDGAGKALIDHYCFFV